MADVNEALSNSGLINQAALAWLNAANDLPDPSASYLAQLAWWGLEKGGVEVSRPLAAEGRPVSTTELAKHYRRTPKARLQSTLATLAALGHVRALSDGRFASVR